MPILSRAKSYAWAIFSLRVKRWSDVCVSFCSEYSRTSTSWSRCAACSLTCSWAASLWSLGHTRGNISTGRCARLSWGTSETTTGARTQDARTRTETQTHSHMCVILPDHHPAAAFHLFGFMHTCSKLAFKKKKVNPCVRFGCRFQVLLSAVHASYSASLDEPQMCPTCQRNWNPAVWSSSERCGVFMRHSDKKLTSLVCFRQVETTSVLERCRGEWLTFKYKSW